MALDEALLEQAHQPGIRFYRWDLPALSFGYFGRFAEVENYRTQRDLVRRWTGGGVVFHGDDLTYSLIIPVSDPAFARSSTWIYTAVHSALRDALVACGEPAKLAAVAGVDHSGTVVSDHGCSSAASECFANPVRSDVLLNGQKIAGAAQRRTRAGLLHQGSIQHANVPNDFGKRFAKRLCENCEEISIDPMTLARAEEIAARKYGTTEWLLRR